jgi:hypothetical protein
VGLRAALLTGLERERPAVPPGVAGRSSRLIRSYGSGCLSSCFRPGKLPAGDYVTSAFADPLPTDGSPPARRRNMHRPNMGGTGKLPCITKYTADLSNSDLFQ